MKHNLAHAALLALLIEFCTPGGKAGAEPLPAGTGFTGIWYSNQPSDDEYKFKYSGGMATYPQQHTPISHYSEAAGKTFFCYGGTNEEGSTLLHMISEFDHATGMIRRPRVLLDKKTTDAHDNPVMSISGDGHIWIFSNSHGTSRPSWIHRSLRPHDITEFELVRETNFSYGQPWWIPDQGFCFLHTRYGGGRVLHWAESADGREWSEPRVLARMEMGHYQTSRQHGSKLGTMFNYHPEPVGLNARTNVYYVETPDAGGTWRTADGTPAETPMTSPEHPALVRDYESEGLLVYLKSIAYDRKGEPVLMYLTSRGYASGPRNDPRQWWTAAREEGDWVFRKFTISDHNYDFGELYIEAAGEGELWRVIAPTEPGPQPYNTGGEMAMWISTDRGESWKLHRRLTRDSEYNHTYARAPMNAHPDFYALWADGHGRKKSKSRLYFTNREGDKVWVLPGRMTEEHARPEVAFNPESEE